MGSKLSWGIIGTADIGRWQVAPAIQGSQYGRVAAIASRDENRARRYAGEIGIEKVYGNYDEILADDDIDAVYIPLPNSLHSEWVERSAEAGKSILCEKPLATSAEEAAKAIDVCERRNVRLMEGFMYRFHPQTLRVKEVIESGEIGEVREVHAHLSVNIRRDADENNIRFQPELGGGALLDMGCYSVSIARMCFGSEPERAAGILRVDERFGVDMSFGAMLEFGGGIAFVSGSFEADGNGAYKIVGTQGSIEVPRGIIPGLDSRAGEGLVIVCDRDSNRREEKFEPVNQYRLMTDTFSKAILDNDSLPLSPEESLSNMKVLDAVSLGRFP
ncbi:MAG: Gfo/Idh/MocA family oxidoreductase [Albidovulum sp.]|nr:Gfo/Idh/MocA family oxidoreductase [Albidovulum sp.]